MPAEKTTYHGANKQVRTKTQPAPKDSNSAIGCILIASYLNVMTKPKTILKYD